MKWVRVVGVGSPFGDDRTGWRVIELLENNLALQPYLEESIDLLHSDRPGLALLNTMHHVETLFIIDAIKTARHPTGYLHQFDGASVNASINNASGFLSTHGFGIASALSLAKAVHKLPELTVIYGVEIGEIDSSAFLSQSVEIACQRLSRKIVAELLTIVKE